MNDSSIPLHLDLRVQEILRSLLPTARFPVVVILTGGSDASSSVFKQVERLHGSDPESQRLVSHVQASAVLIPVRLPSMLEAAFMQRVEVADFLHSSPLAGQCSGGDAAHQGVEARLHAGGRPLDKWMPPSPFSVLVCDRASPLTLSLHLLLPQHITILAPFTTMQLVCFLHLKDLFVLWLSYSESLYLCFFQPSHLWI